MKVNIIKNGKGQRMKNLAEYLTKYIEHSKERPDCDVSFEDMPTVTEQALEAYQSTENVTIKIAPALTEGQWEEPECKGCGASILDCEKVPLINVDYPDDGSITYKYQCECGKIILEQFSRDYLEFGD